MKWSILILTQPSRDFYLKRLLGVLSPQVSHFPDVEIRTRMDDKKLDRGGNRRALLEEASGEYSCFIDDDDLVPSDYVRKIHPLLDGVDYIGFEVQYFRDGVKQRPTYHSLKHNNWSDDGTAWYRDISHVNPIRRELALQAPYKGDGNEDVQWADAMRNLGIVQTEHYIPEPMYLYYYRSSK